MLTLRKAYTEPLSNKDRSVRQQSCPCLEAICAAEHYGRSPFIAQHGKYASRSTGQHTLPGTLYEILQTFEL